MVTPEDWERRARECERARSQIVARIDAARREVYDVNFRAEQAEAVATAALDRAIRSEVATAAALERIEQAKAKAIATVALDRATRSEAATAAAEAGLRQALQERDAILSSTIWRATAPVRTIADHAAATLQRLRSGRH